MAGALALTLLAGCGGGSDDAGSQASQVSSPTSPTSATGSDGGSPKPHKTRTANTSDEGSEETLADVGVSAALARQMIGVADDLGYGPADRSFVWVMVATCRDVLSGASSYGELIDQDVADGAPRVKATQMYAFLKSTFCPHVKAPADQQQTQAAGPGTPPPGLQALGASVSVFDAKWKPASQAPCRAAQGAPLGKARAYAFVSTSGTRATLCLDYIERDPLGDVQDSLAVVYATPVSTATVLADLGKLLPKDARVVGRLTGHNPPYAAHSGSCLSVLYSSQDWRQQMSQYDSSDEFGITYGTKLTAVLYSDRQTSYGSSSSYNGTARFVDVGSGGHNFASGTRKVTC